MSHRSVLRSSFSAFRFFCSSALSVNTTKASNLKESFGAKLFRIRNPFDAPWVIAKWKLEGHDLSIRDIRNAVRGLINHERSLEALIIWDSLVEQRIVERAAKDYACHLCLIAKHRGLPAAEKYFEEIPAGIRGEFIYRDLLKIYVQRRETAKAEALMEKMAGGGFFRAVQPYIQMMSLYMSIGENDKAEEMSKEVKKRIKPKVGAYGMWLNACALANNVEAADMVFSLMKEAKVEPDWLTHSTLADLYIKNKLFEKAASALKEMEKLVSTVNRKLVYCSLIRMHGNMGNKDGVLRIWEMTKLKCKISDYMYSMMVFTLLKVDSYEKAEDIFSEWAALLKGGIVPKIHRTTSAFLIKAKAEKHFPTVEEDGVDTMLVVKQCNVDNP